MTKPPQKKENTRKKRKRQGESISLKFYPFKGTRKIPQTLSSPREALAYIDPNNPQQYCEVETIIFLQIWKLRIQEVKEHTQDRTARRQRSWDLNPGLYDPKFYSLPMLAGCQHSELHTGSGG